MIARPLWPSDSATVAGAGLPAALAWLLLLAVWLAAGLRDGRLDIRWRKLDIALAVLVVWFAASGLWAVSHAAPRPAINVTWEWVALAAIFWLVRQWVRTPAEARALLAVMIAVSVVETGYALEQYFVTLPADRAAYAADPDGMLRQNGLWFEPGSRERYLFEQRLASTEPFGTFELANSLGGFLAAWLVVVCGIAGTTLLRRDSGESPRAIGPIVIVAALTALPLAATLMLTKSRSAVLGLVVGLLAIACLVLEAPALRTTRSKYYVIAGAAALLLVAICFGWFTGAFDWQVLSEAPKSLGYRWQYWQGTFPIIRDHPLLGCGPGNFRDAYPAYRLAEASEEIADPHNLLLEVTAIAGVPAGAAILIVLAAAVVIGIRSRDGNVSPSVENGAGAVTPILAAAIAGFLFAFALPWLVGPLVPVTLGLGRMLAGVAVAAVTIVLWLPWIRSGTLSPWVPAIGAGALLVNFLAAGGIGFPAIAGSLWLLLALSLLLVDMNHPATRVGRKVLLPACMAAIALAAACYATAYRPVTSAARALIVGLPDQNAAEIESQLLAATAADPLDSQPWAQLASFRFTQWSRDRDDEAWRGFELAASRMLELRPNHSAAWSFVGDCYLRAAQLSADPSRRKEAVRTYQRAVELYPMQALRHAKLAIALADSGDSDAARREASEAIRLDDFTPHIDQKLPADLRKTVESLAAPASG